MYQYYEQNRESPGIKYLERRDERDNFGDIDEINVNYSHPLRLITGAKYRLFQLEMKIAQQPELFGVLGNLDNLIEGTLNLINLIITCSQEDPIDTLIFLDKSARPAQYLFRTLWSELKRTNKIPTNQKMPTIRFINIGPITPRFLTDPDEIETFIKTKYRSADFEQKRVLVVDERTHSGGSVRRTMRLLSSVFEVEVEGLSMLRTYPSWYLYHSYKGVVDSPDSPRSISQLISAPSKDKQITAKSKVLRVGLKKVAKKAAELVYVDESDASAT